MASTARVKWRQTMKYVISCFILLVVLMGGANANQDDPAASLRVKHDAILMQLQHNPFHRPLVLDSSDSAHDITGDIYAELDYPFARVNTAFNGPEHWCDMLILHLNTKYCRSETENGNAQLQVRVGKKHDEPLADAYPVNFIFTHVTSAPQYFHVALHARNGPMGTSDYRILMETIALPDHRSFLHLTYSYRYGLAARIAMQAYLGTAGRDKIGFTRTDDSSGNYIGGVRGVVERNTMRYYLAIEAYLSAQQVPSAQQLDRRLEAWFDASEKYPRQLHEIDRADYLHMKHREYQRQQNTR